MRRIILLLALAAIMATVLAGSALPAVAQGMNCGWWWDWWYGWYWACY